MQENTTNRNRLALRARAGLALCGMFAAASFLACGEEAPAAVSSNEEDSAAAYAALSANLEACEAQLDDCTDDAAGDATKQAACDAAAVDCNMRAQGAEEHARNSLKHDADRCKKHGGKDEDAGTTDDGGAGDMHGCIGRHVPKLPMCVKELLTCLDDAGLRKHDATRKEIGECLHDAHDCFKAELKKKREERRTERKERDKSKHGNAAGSVSGPAAGAPAAAGGPASNNAYPSAAGAGGGGAAGSGSKSNHMHLPVLPPFWKH